MTYLFSTTTWPTSGQFVGVWFADGVAWSTTYKLDGNSLYRYDETADEWVVATESLTLITQNNGFFLQST